MKIIQLLLWALCWSCVLCKESSRRRSENDEESISDKLETLLTKTSSMQKHLKGLERKIDELVKRSNAQLAHMAELQKANWQTIQRRQDGTVNFYRNWTEYKTGFGNHSDSEFFVGLEKLHELTSGKPHELLIILKDWENDTRYAHYSHFEIAGEDANYALRMLGEYSGNAGDGMQYYLGQKFSTFDNDNDEDANTNCARLYQSAWWFKNCALSDLNGPYQEEDYATNDGVTWSEWTGMNYSLKFAEMKIKPKIV